MTHRRILSWRLVPLFWLGAALSLVTGCGGNRPPIVTPPDPPPPICDGRDVHIYVYSDDPGGPPMPGVVIRAEGQDDRITGHEGHAHFWACGPADYTFEAANWQTENCGELGSACNFAGPAHNVHMTRIEPDPIPVHPDPVVGRLRTDGNQCFADDTGCRNFAIAHMGDLVARWMYGCREECLRDLDDAAAAGYHIIRAWWHLGIGHWPWDQGGSPPYPGVDVFETPNYVAQGVELARAVAARGMRIAIGSGGIARMNSQQERDMARVFRQAIDGAGPDAFAWAEGVNEPSSTHATSDNDGDNQPANLSALTRIMTEGTALLFHGGYWTANNYQEDAGHQLPGQRYNYVHGWRGGNVGNKIDRRSTWARIYAEQAGRPELRLTIDGESVGWPVNGLPLRYVSATANAHEMDSHEALGLIAAATALRGIPSHMSGTGVQRYEPFTNTVGWRQIPWVVRTFPREIATWPIFHGGQSDSRLVFKATTNAAGVLGRVEQAVGPDGSFGAVAYNYQRPDQHQSFELARTATFRECDVAAMTCSEERTLERGQRYEMTAEWGRVLIGRAQ